MHANHERHYQNVICTFEAVDNLQQIKATMQALILETHDNEVNMEQSDTDESNPETLKWEQVLGAKPYATHNKTFLHAKVTSAPNWDPSADVIDATVNNDHQYAHICIL